MNRAILSRINLGLWVALVAVTLGGYLLIPSETWLPVHWGPSGEPDAFWPRDMALLMPPLIGLAVTLVFWAVGRFAPPAQLEASRHAWRTVVPALSGLFLTIQTGVVLVGLGYPDLMVRMICFAIGVMLVVLGNIMPKMQPNGLAGIRLPWLGDALVWQKTQRLGGLLFMVGGLVLLACAAFLGEPMYMFAALLIALLLPLVGTAFYSYRIAHRR
ncbi:SdpI family protein [Devosia albogilva]|uniref:SdpI family protein n=1 Tax=Devosia albogilva TaxID=429726 RepID=A0ABW5QM47_9HYPH